MERKRDLSPSSSACTHDQLTKRLRVASSPVMSSQQCLHCGSGYHKWVQCTNRCSHCGDTHPKKRCTVLGVEAYTPGGFNVRLSVGSRVYKLSNDHPMSDFGSVRVKQESTDGANLASSAVVVRESVNAGKAASRRDQAHADAVAEALGPNLLEQLEAVFASDPNADYNQLNQSTVNSPEEGHTDDVTMVDSELAPGVLDSAALADRFLDELTVYQSATSAAPALTNDTAHCTNQGSFDEIVNRQSAITYDALPVRNASGPTTRINPERAAMIAVTSVVEQPKQVIGQVDGLGPQCSGMNSMPLGRARPIGSSQLSGTSQLLSAAQPARAPQLNVVPQFSGGAPFTGVPQFSTNHQLDGASRPTTGSYFKSASTRKCNSIPLRSGTIVDRTALARGCDSGNASGARSKGKQSKRSLAKRKLANVQVNNNAYERIIWDNLKHHIRSAVREVASTNAEIGKRNSESNVIAALMALRPVILGKNGSPRDFDDNHQMGVVDRIPTAAPLADIYEDAERVQMTAL